MKRLFVVDLDDTLLSDGIVPPSVLAVWQRIICSGAPVTIATARGFRAATAALGDAFPRLPVVALNGAVVAGSVGTNANVQRIPADFINPICRLAYEVGAIPCFVATDGWNESLFIPSGTDAFTEWTVNDACYFKTKNVVRDRSPTLDEQARIARVILCTTVDAAKQLEQVISSQFLELGTASIWSRSQPGRAWLEIGAANATKANGVSHVASLLNIPLPEIVYYGNARSDLSVMAIVGEAVAVSNAEDDVLAAADRIIGPAASGAVPIDLLTTLGMESENGPALLSNSID